MIPYQHPVVKKYFALPAAIAFLTCHGCMVVPAPVPAPVASSKPAASPTQLEAGWEKTCYAEALTQSQASKISESSESLENEADKLAVAGKHKQAIRKYNEASAAAMNEAIADGSAPDMEIDTLLYDKEDFRDKNRPLIQKSAESNFKIGSSYARIGEFERAIDCFNGTLKIGILPPNDAITYLNRGDAYLRTGDREKARQDFQQSADLFRKYKLPQYRRMALDKLKSAP